MNIKNKKAYFNFNIIEKFVAGIELFSTEIRPVKEGRISFSDSYCYFNNNELFLKNFYIGEHKQATINLHESLRDRKLLLTRHQLKKLLKRITEKGLTIVPISIFVNDKNLIKMEIALAKGKNIYDKSKKIKERDIERSMKHELKYK